MTSVPAQSAVPDEATPPGPAATHLKRVKVSLRSRVIVWLLRKLLRPWLARMAGGSLERMAKMQLQMASQVCKDSSGLPLEYTVLGRVPGHLVGNIRHTHKPVILYLHGGAFIMPAVPMTHVWFLARMCSELDAVGFMADYRLAPFSQFPAALDDCEAAYRALLDLGFPASRIVVAGESAGGNLALGLLQRIRKHGWPMPACAVPVSPATEMGRIHAPPSRALKRHSDPILPIATLQRVSKLYAGDWDTADPELSPLYMDCTGLPPLYFLATESEVLLDDTVLLARRAREQGVKVKLDVWPVFPHAFPLFGQLFPEVREARKDMVAFMREHLHRG
jgi:monoterpene epsilon-lactone hydrolase